MTFDGIYWTYVIARSVTVHIDSQGDAMLFSDVVPSKNATARSVPRSSDITVKRKLAAQEA